MRFLFSVWQETKVILNNKKMAFVSEIAYNDNGFFRYKIRSQKK